MAASTPLFVTTKVKVTFPPVSGTAVGLAVLVTLMSGFISVTVTVWLSDAEASCNSLSITVIDASLS